MTKQPAEDDYFFEVEAEGNTTTMKSKGRIVEFANFSASIAYVSEVDYGLTVQQQAIESR